MRRALAAVLLLGCAPPAPPLPCEGVLVPPGSYSQQEWEALPDDPTLERIPCDAFPFL